MGTTSTPNSTNSIASTELEKKSPSYFKGICDIIESCKKGDVIELHLGDLAIFRTNDANYFAFSNRNPNRLPPAWEAPPQERGKAVDNRPISDMEKEALQVQEALAREEREANLILEDPGQWERQQLDALEGKATGLTAEQVAELDDEELD